MLKLLWNNQSHYRITAIISSLYLEDEGSIPSSGSMKKPNFEKMQLFQLMEWAESNNYDDDLNPIVEDFPDDINPFEPPPNNFKGDSKDWYRELDILMDWVKIEYVSICNTIWSKKNV